MKIEFASFVIERERMRKRGEKRINLKGRWASGFDRCVFQSMVVVNIKMPYWCRRCVHFWRWLGLDWPANDDVRDDEMYAIQWNSLKLLHLANHAENVVMIVGQRCHATYLHCYHMNAVANDSMDFVSQPMTVLGAKDRCLVNELDALVLLLLGKLSNYFCNEKKNKIMSLFIEMSQKCWEKKLMISF